MDISSKTQVIFDLDGTVCDLVMDWQRWCQHVSELLRKNNPSFVWTDYLSIFEEQNRQVLAGDRKLKSITDQYTSQYETDNLRDLTPIPTAIDILKQHSATFHLWSGNTTPTINMVLERLGLLGKFSTIVGRDTLSTIKPHPAGFSRINSLHLPTSDFVFIGDSPTDQLTAQNCGIDFTHIRELLS